MAEQLNEDIKTTGIEIVFHRKITAMSQEQMMDFVKIQKDVKRFGCKNKTCMCRGYTCIKGNNRGDCSDEFVSNGTVCESSKGFGQRLQWNRYVW